MQCCCNGHPKQQNSLGSQRRPFVLGIGKASFKQCKTNRPVTEDILYPSLSSQLQQTNQNNASSTPESPQASNSETLKDRLLRLRPLAPGTELFQTSGLASISKGEGCSRYWTSQSLTDSKSLWLPTETGLCDLDSSLSSASSMATEPFLQCFTLQTSKEILEQQSSQTTSFQSLRFSQPVTMVDEEDSQTERRCKKIRIYPTKAQTAMFNKFCGSNRYFYNQANTIIMDKIKDAKESRFKELVAMTEEGPCCVHQTYPKAKKGPNGETIPSGPPIRCTNTRIEGNKYFCAKHKDKGSLGISYSSFFSLPKLRPLVMRNDDDIPDGSKDVWQKDVPYDTRQGAIKELLSAYESAFALKKNGHIQHFQVKYKLKKAPKQVFHCRANAFDAKTSTIFKTRLKKGRGRKVRVRRRDLSKLLKSDGEEDHGDFTIQKVRPGAWYICLPRKTKPEKLAPVYENAAYKSAFLDPGVRTFATYYSPDGVCGKIGDRFCEKFLDKLAFRIDFLNALKDKKKHGTKSLKYNKKTRAHIAMRCASLRNKIKHKTDDLHWKTCIFLCTAFRNIFIPHFGTKDMVQKEGRKINCLTTRRMLELSHGRFLERLKYVAKTKQRNVFEVPESYTTKTCGACGAENPNVGGSKVFNCVSEDCPYRKMDRDIHGARNIAISTMSRMRQHTVTDS